MEKSLQLDNEINKRIGTAAATCNKLTRQMWNNCKLSNKTKITVCEACVLITLFYGSESWYTYARHEGKPHSFNMRCFRKVLRIPWQHRILDTEVLKKVCMENQATTIRKKRLRWLGHVGRMDDERLPKAILYDETTSERRKMEDPNFASKTPIRELWLTSASTLRIGSRRLQIGRPGGVTFTLGRSLIMKSRRATDKERGRGVKTLTLSLLLPHPTSPLISAGGFAAAKSDCSATTADTDVPHGFQCQQGKSDPQKRLPNHHKMVISALK